MARLYSCFRESIVFSRRTTTPPPSTWEAQDGRESFAEDTRILHRGTLRERCYAHQGELLLFDRKFPGFWFGSLLPSDRLYGAAEQVRSQRLKVLEGRAGLLGR